MIDRMTRWLVECFGIVGLTLALGGCMWGMLALIQWVMG